jgi:hypothetical protein
MQVFHAQRKRVTGLKYDLTRYQEIEHNAERVNIRCRSSLLTQKALWRDVGRCPHHLAITS